MLTPKFHLSQDPNFLHLHIHVPHLKLNDVDSYVEGDEFYFYSQPYYLRLHLPGNVVDTDKSKSVYDSDTGSLEVHLEKENKGEHFEGLELLTKLLTPKSTHSSKALETNIEVLSSSDSQQATNPDHWRNEKEDKDSAFEVFQKSLLEDEDLLECIETDDWFIRQNVEDALMTLPDLLPSSNKYGFAMTKIAPLNKLASELTNLFDVNDPDFVSLAERRRLRLEQEDGNFSCEHYLADLFDDENIQLLLGQEFPWLTGNPSQEMELDDSEREKLLQLPRKEYLIEASALSSTYLGLVDLVFAFAFEFRSVGGEFNVESDWTICKLSATLSWLDSFQSLKDVILSCARRCLAFPLYRNWNLFERVLVDVRKIFQIGRTAILRCLLSIQNILSKSESHYPLNDIYVKDYCVWIQSADSKQIQSLSDALNSLSISKNEVGFRLDEMEEDAVKLMECEDDPNDDEDKSEVNVMDKLIKSMNKVVSLSECKESDSDDIDSTSDDIDSTSDDSDSTSNDSDTSSSSDSDTSCSNDNDLSKSNPICNDEHVKDRI